MYVTIRLYWPSDIDLIAVRTFEGHSFNSIVRRCMDACLHGNAYTYQVPDGLCRAVRAMPSSPDAERGPIRAGVVINARKYGDICSFLAGIPRLQRGTIVKAFVRACFSRYPAELLALPGLASSLPTHGPEGAGAGTGRQHPKPGDGKAKGHKAPQSPKTEAAVSPAAAPMEATPHNGMGGVPSYAAPDPAAGNQEPRQAGGDAPMDGQPAGNDIGPDGLDAFDIFSSMM